MRCLYNLHSNYKPPSVSVRTVKFRAHNARTLAQCTAATSLCGASPKLCLKLQNRSIITVVVAFCCWGMQFVVLRLTTVSLVLHSIFSRRVPLQYLRFMNLCSHTIWVFNFVLSQQSSMLYNIEIKQKVLLQHWISFSSLLGLSTISWWVEKFLTNKWAKFQLCTPFH